MNTRPGLLIIYKYSNIRQMDDLELIIEKKHLLKKIRKSSKSSLH